MRSDLSRGIVAYGVAIVLGLGLGWGLKQIVGSEQTASTCAQDIADSADKVILGSGTALKIIGSALENPTEYNLRYAESELDNNLPNFKAQADDYKAMKAACNV
jgi:hypothetical protein